MTERPRERGDGAAVRAVRERGADRERAHARRAALPRRGLRAELHRHAAARGLPLETGVTAVPLYASGLPLNRTARPLGASTPGVTAWIERSARSYARTPEPEGRARVIEPDELGHDLKENPTSSGCGGLGIGLRDVSSVGSWAAVTGPPVPG